MLKLLLKRLIPKTWGLTFSGRPPGGAATLILLTDFKIVLSSVINDV